MECPKGCGWKGEPSEYITHLENCPKKSGCEEASNGVVYHKIRQEQFASEFLENCIQKTREVYGLTEPMVKKLLKDMGY